MKTRIFTLFLALCCGLLFGCGGPGTEEETGMKTVDEILAQTAASELTCSKYQLKKYTQPYWKSQIVYNETVMFVADAQGNVPEKKLAFPIAKVLEVRDSTLGTQYAEGTDYAVTGEGSLRLTGGSRIPVTVFADYYVEQDKGAGALSKSQPGRYLDYGEGDYFYRKQVCVTYIRTEEYQGPAPVFRAEGLPATLAKLKNRENLKIVFYGDSITTGCNASGNYDALPNMPRFDQMTVSRLKDWYGYDGTDISLVNTAMGGWLSENGKGELQTRVLDHNPDLVVLGFGMNDGTWNISEDVFGANIDFMVRKLKAANPACEVLLLSTMLPNPDATTAANGDFFKKQKDYLPVLRQIADGYEGVEVADVTSLHEQLLLRKDYCDMTGNNVNHPSDFLVRVYAQVILSHLIENYH